MFSLDAVTFSTRERWSGGTGLGEIVATLGLLLVVFGISRRGTQAAVPFAVGAYITGAYFFTSSTSFANPAVTIGRMLSNTFAGISPASVAPFVAAQLAGAAVAWLLIAGCSLICATARAHVLVPRPLTADDPRMSAMPKPEVLFVCVHNAGRSQMAAALLDHHARGSVHVRSAGSEPADALNPAVVAVMAEVGIDIAREFPKPLTADAVVAADVVITMGCGDACPIYPGKRYLDWALDDPAGESVVVVRRIRDQIDARVRELLEELSGGAAGS